MTLFRRVMEDVLGKADRFICWAFGHMPTKVSTQTLTAWCGRCGAKLDVSYDMSNGQTVCLGEHKEAPK